MDQVNKILLQGYVERNIRGCPVLSVGYGDSVQFTLEDLRFVVELLEHMEEQDALELLREQG